MKTKFHFAGPLLMGAVLLLSTSLADARVYGVASGPNRTVVSGRRGVAVSGPNGSAAARRPVARPVVVAPRPVVVAPRPVVVAPRPVVVAPRPVVVAPVLPRGYVSVVPAGYRTVVYRGYNCRFVGGVYYRPVLYQGATVYVTVD